MDGGFSQTATAFVIGTHQVGCITWPITYSLSRGHTREESTLVKFLRGIQRVFSVKYLFGEANTTYNYLLLEDG